MREGRKDDAGKPDYSLLTMRHALDAVVRVLEHGAKRYGRDNWRAVEPPGRYLAAAGRHLVAHLAGEASDPDTGESHLAHVVCCCLFALERAER